MRRCQLLAQSSSNVLIVKPFMDRSQLAVLHQTRKTFDCNLSRTMASPAGQYRGAPL
jgi:hypothetical protein